MNDMQFRNLGRTGLKVADGRADHVRETYLNDQGYTLVECLEEVARRHQAMVAQISLAWLLARQAIVSPITSVNPVAQWRDLAGSGDVKLTPEDISALDEASSWA